MLASLPNLLFIHGSLMYWKGRKVWCHRPGFAYWLSLFMDGLQILTVYPPDVSFSLSEPRFPCVHREAVRPASPGCCDVT